MVAQLTQHDPRRIGPFEVLGRLGAGGMGLVYLARSASGRRVAIKTVRTELAEDQLFRVRFTREVEAARAVSGFYTAAVVDADPRAAVPWLATAYVPAPSLEEIVNECGPLPAQAVRWLAAGIAEALQSIHGAGLVHRDLKPSNVLVVEDGPRVIDFGIASGVSNTRLTMTNVAVGTPAYMSPEQARDSRSVTGASDIFSLGSTLVFAATGHAPFHGANPVETVFMLLREGPDLEGLPGELRPLIESCMQMEAARRPSPADLQSQLAPHLFAAGTDDSGTASAWLPTRAVSMIEQRRGGGRPSAGAAADGGSGGRGRSVTPHPPLPRPQAPPQHPPYAPESDAPAPVAAGRGGAGAQPGGLGGGAPLSGGTVVGPGPRVVRGGAVQGRGAVAGHGAGVGVGHAVAPEARRPGGPVAAGWGGGAPEAASAAVAPGVGRPAAVQARPQDGGPLVVAGPDGDAAGAGSEVRGAVAGQGYGGGAAGVGHGGLAGGGDGGAAGAGRGGATGVGHGAGAGAVGHGGGAADGAVRLPGTHVAIGPGPRAGETRDPQAEAGAATGWVRPPSSAPHAAVPAQAHAPSATPGHAQPSAQGHAPGHAQPSVTVSHGRHGAAPAATERHPTAPVPDGRAGMAGYGGAGGYGSGSTDPYGGSGAGSGHGAGPAHGAAAAPVPPLAHAPAPVAEPAQGGPARWRPWRFRMSNDVWGTPAVAGNLLYVTSFEVHALDIATGRRQFKTRDVAWAMAVADGRIHASDGPTLYALNALDGSELWRLNTDGWVYSLKADRGVVVTGTRGGGVQAWDAASGERLWELSGAQADFETPESGPALHGGTVYVWAGRHLRAIDTLTGRDRWSQTVGDAASCGGVPVRLLPAPDGVVYVSAGTRVLAIEAAHGDLRWRFEAPAVFLSPPAYAPGPAVTGGGVYLADYLGTVYAIDAADGRDRWRIATEARQSADPVLVAAGSVHLGSGGALYTLDAVTGTPKWRFAAQGEVIGAPVVADGRVHFGSADHCLYTLDAGGGQLRWKLATGGEITGTPLVAGGVVYACSKDRCVYALDAQKGTGLSRQGASGQG